MISAILASESALYRNCAQVPWPGNACCGSSASCFTQLRNCVGWTPRSSDACAYDTPRSLISRTASSLNSRVNCRLSMTHLLLHKTPNSVSSEPGAAQPPQAKFKFIHSAALLSEKSEEPNRSCQGVLLGSPDSKFCQRTGQTRYYLLGKSMS